MRFTIYPWDLTSWRSAFRVTGLPGIALFCLLIGAMFQVADTTGGGAGHSSSAAILLVRTPAIILAFLLLLSRPRIAPMRWFDMRFAYGLFALLYFLSLAWSQERVQTIGKSGELLLAGMVFFEATRAENAIERVEGLRRITLLAMATVGTLAVVGYLARMPAFVQHRPGLISSTTAQAPFLSGNGLGYVASALLLVVLAEWQAKRISGKAAFWQVLFGLGLFSFSASRTSFGILLLSVLLVLFKRSKILATLAVTGVLLAGFLFWSGILSRLQGHQNSSDFVTLSGRTVVWTAAVRQFEQNPILGVGGGIGGKVVISHIGNRYLEEMSSLHNGFLELLTGLGLVGFLLGTYMLVGTTLRAWQAWDTHPEYAGTYVLIIHVWMTTTMSTGILGWMGYEVALFLCILSNVDLIAERARALSRYQVKPLRWSRQALIPRSEAVN
ncbi:MAG TPA: O-antigen ligase family protein [Terracidiphilus sp.]|jgi:O-antigen ligase|nr:O-antigen ligase family protein [Terracidiphilus sp.]